MLVDELVSELADRLLFHNLTLASAESCTGGWLGRELTALAGSSHWYEGGVISYSNAIKEKVLHVPSALLNQHGAVSEPVALAMALGVQSALNTDASVAVTGIAGPGGGSLDKPVGTVWIAWCYGEQTHTCCFLFKGTREEIRQQAVRESLLGLLNLSEEIKK
ncbi:damage-inducible protein CinA [Endozoicomonas sp. (ex Bugula neritina AB1)]|nr:damage-inducible protein CinA [Endozoicomonas sp. (ex Bugula neritina AB1)]